MSIKASLSEEAIKIYRILNACLKINTFDASPPLNFSTKFEDPTTVTVFGNIFNAIKLLEDKNLISKNAMPDHEGFEFKQFINKSNSFVLKEKHV